MIRKVRRQVAKDYLLFPLLTGPLAPLTLAGNVAANLTRNIWTFSIIFCGHFPAGVETFSIEETEGETRGGWYYRQMLGSANITGGKLFHIMSGNLSHQIEHHLFPDMPAARYPKIAPEVRAIAEKYGLEYNSKSFSRQLGSVYVKIAKLALPDSVADLRRGLRLPRFGRKPAQAPVTDAPAPDAEITIPVADVDPGAESSDSRLVGAGA
jgi:fatty acid desaturase